MNRLQELQVFHDCLKRHIAFAHNHGWSKQVSAGFTLSCINGLHLLEPPKWGDRRKFRLFYSDHNQDFTLQDLNVRELMELELYVQRIAIPSAKEVEKEEQTR